MSLAHVAVPTSTFDEVYDHIISYNPRSRNMHMREACQRQGQRDLRYLHAMYAPPGQQRIIEGAISGPTLFWRYSLLQHKGRTQMNVAAEPVSSRARQRMSQRFLREITNRVDEEKARAQFFGVNRTPGQFYLRRWRNGSAANDPTCVQAVEQEVLDQRFVAILQSWNFQLLCP